MIDIDEIRKAHITMHQLTKADMRYVFYHDETNNIKKLRLREKGFNVATLDIFVLGGVVHQGPHRQLDIKSLRQDMRIQKSANEIKLEHVAKGDFLNLLKSEKLTIFLKWISDNNLFIHYHALDPLYWSIVDIIDSILHGVSDAGLFAMHIPLKADLTTVLRERLSETANLLYRYNYPDLSSKNRKAFLNELIDMLEQAEDVLSEFNSMMLKGVLQMGRDLSNLEFIEGFTPHGLIDSFSMFYLTRISVFKYSEHILDQEDSIRDELTASPLVSGGKPITNFKFVDSKSETGIQLSDVIVGLIGKMYSYLASSEYEDIIAARASLIGTSLRNVELLSDLIDASHEANIAFLNHVMSSREIDKMNLFFKPYDYAITAQ